MNKIKLSDKQIFAKKDIFLSTITREEELAVNGRISEIQIFLNKIKDLIETAINKNLSYKKIAKTIYSTYNVKVSDQTVKRFAENTLGVKKEASFSQSSKAKSTDTKIVVVKSQHVPVTDPKSEEKTFQTDSTKKTPANFLDV